MNNGYLKRSNDMLNAADGTQIDEEQYDETAV